MPFADFLAPGLIVMAMIQNAFANSSFSLLVGKIQGTIVDYLMPPLSTGELIAGLIGAAVTRAFLVGGAVWLAMLLWPGVHVAPHHLWAILWFGLMGSMMLGFLGLITSIWAEKFDHAAAVTNFVVAPLSLLSGTFYSIDSLSPLFRAISHANPFFFVISGFRYGFVGAADSPILFGALLLLGLNVRARHLLLRAASQRLEAERLMVPPSVARKRRDVVSFIQTATIMNGFCRARSPGAQRRTLEAASAKLRSKEECHA